jgi:hypothetical protein
MAWPVNFYDVQYNVQIKTNQSEGQVICIFFWPESNGVDEDIVRGTVVYSKVISQIKKNVDQTASPVLGSQFFFGSTYPGAQVAKLLFHYNY